jgi:hypothetical protein
VLASTDSVPTSDQQQLPPADNEHLVCPNTGGLHEFRRTAMLVPLRFGFSTPQLPPADNKHLVSPNTSGLHKFRRTAMLVPLRFSPDNTTTTPTSSASHLKDASLHSRTTSHEKLVVPPNTQWPSEEQPCLCPRDQASTRHNHNTTTPQHHNTTTPHLKNG